MSGGGLPSGSRVAQAGAVFLLLLAFACTSGPESSTRGQSAGSGPGPGGTLRAAMSDRVLPLVELDPQRAYSNLGFERFRCCLLRTLYSYNGKPTEEGGGQLRPDLAEGPPEISGDGLTWTFHLKQGLHYAPPLNEVEITAPDIIRAIRRMADVNPAGRIGGYPFYYSPIEGFDDYRSGASSGISGLQTPDDRTLIVRLNDITGDLAYRFSMPGTAPIPEGAADGHATDYARFLVASGPYMIEGSEDLDPSLPPAKQEPVAGLVPGTPAGDDAQAEAGSLTFVRNPSWDPATDGLRPAYPDRIEFVLGQEVDAIARGVDRGELDLAFGEDAPPEQVERYRGDPALSNRVFVHAKSAMVQLTMNLAVPPFDDLHIRRAVALAIDKEPLVRMMGDPPYGPFGASAGVVATHLAPDSLEGDLLHDFDPYPHDLNRAMEEVRQSPYDGDGDGVCDAAECRAVEALVLSDGSVVPEQGKAIRGDLARIGIDLDLQPKPVEAFFNGIYDPARRAAMGIGHAWATDMPVGTGWFPPLFASDTLGSTNASLLGASPSQLRRWGYGVTSVPNMDDRLQGCLAETGEAQTACWAQLDQYMMSEVVPWVPYVTLAHAQVVSERVVAYSFDQFAELPALDRIALAPNSD
jgi:peptide/nickel transport system substrate-binding protein